MSVLRLGCILTLLLAPLPLAAQSKSFGLSAPDALVETGFLKHLLPRFSLKTGIRIALNDGTRDAALTVDGGLPVFEADDGTLWYFAAEPDPMTDRFADWLRSDVGKRTIEAFARDGAPRFRASDAAPEATVVAAFDGNAAKGETVSLRRCGRCHVINESNRMNAIGSTPSFPVLRTLGNWTERFETFYVRAPHGAFTQIADVTAPFDPSLPPPIAPVELTLDELDAILAYVATIEPADLGAPIQSQ